MVFARRGVLAASFALGLSGSALAQSKDDVAERINSTLPDNGRGQITAAGLRGLLTSFNGARGVPNGIAELGPDGRIVPSQGQSTFAQMKLGPSLSPLDMTFAGTQNPNAIMLGVGNQVSFCPALSCIKGSSDVADVPSFYDHQRASLLVSAQTQDDAHSEEQTLAVTTTINKGFMKEYAANTAYSLGDNVKVGSVVYRVVQAGTTGANSQPQGTRPNAAQSGQYQAQDGSVRFLWINDIPIAGKVGSYFETKVDEGAGGAWGAAFNYHLNAAPKPGNFFQGVEIDYTNSGGNCPIGIDCTGVRLALGGKQITHGFYLEGSTTENPTSIWGFRTAGSNLAQFAAIAEDSGSPVGLGFNIGDYGSRAKNTPSVHHEVAAIQDNSISPFGLWITGNKTNAEINLNGASPKGLTISNTKSSSAIEDTSTANVGILVGGTKSLSGFRDSSTAPVGMALAGTYSTAQIAGNGFSISPDGSLVVPRIRETAPRTIASATTACTQGERAYDANYEYRCVDTNTWKRAALSSW